MKYLFKNRREAGKKLGKLIKEQGYSELELLALPLGGVVVADEVAKILNLPFNVVISRKIGAPGNPEFGIGAISEDEIPSFDTSMLNYFNPDTPEVNDIIYKEKLEVKRRIYLYRRGQPLNNIEGKNIILIDDGIASGGTAISAAKFIRSLYPNQIILAAPVGPNEMGQELEKHFDEIICLYAPWWLMSIGLCYHDFTHVSDQEVIKLLDQYH